MEEDKNQQTEVAPEIEVEEPVSECEHEHEDIVHAETCPSRINYDNIPEEAQRARRPQSKAGGVGVGLTKFFG